jgi:hypothetical protein
MIIKQFLFWLPMIVLAFVNATLRELVFVKHFTMLAAHQLSTITLMLLCSAYTWWVYPKLHLQSAKEALTTGVVWMLLTVVFEFSLGRFTGKSWDFLLQDYNLFAGRIWLVFLFCLSMLPYVVYSVKS